MSKPMIGHVMAVDRCRFNVSQLMAMFYLTEDLSKEQRQAAERLLMNVSADIEVLSELFKAIEN